MKLYFCFLALFIAGVVAEKDAFAPWTGPSKRQAGGPYVGCPTRNPDVSASCTGDMCPVMDCRQMCCFDGCSSFCHDPETSAPGPLECPWKEASGGFGCSENMCEVMRCAGGCCYDGCKSFCRGLSAATSSPWQPPVPSTTEDICPMKEPTGGFGCSENMCPVMRCNSRCCYDGCRSFCQPLKREPTAFYANYDYYTAGGVALRKGYVTILGIWSVVLMFANY